MSQESLMAYLKNNYAIHRYNHYSLTELENMLPWEREAITFLILEDLRKQEESNG